MGAPRRYFVHTFGCRVNQADSAQVAAALDTVDAMERTTSHADADVVVLNTCTVTHRSDADVRKAVKRIQRENPSAKVIITGCYAQRDPEGAAALPGVGAVIGNAHKSRLPVVASDLMTPTAAPEARAPVVIHTPMDGVDPELLPGVEPVTTVLDRTRPFVKIQDGCDAVCTYCIIPAVRGRARSATPQDVLHAVRTLVDQGYVEIVLAGVHLGTYGRALVPPMDLGELVKRVLDVQGLVRLRLSAIEPMAFPMELARVAAADPRLAPHFHLPLQSGSDRVLKRMVRPYRAKEFAELVAELRSHVPDACVGTDVIVGFPGEDDAAFEASAAFVEEASGLDYVHVFSYSDRDGVPSTRLDAKVDPRIIKQRSTALHEVSARLWTRYVDGQVGRVRAGVSLEREGGLPGVVEVLTDNYIPVEVTGAALAPNQDVRVTITERVGNRARGVLQSLPA
ncbi:MAG: tRNA (N(6)-L-threonylcarbamoyladenosine(37)-C(2))-methylthiotransferase MtaB [Deltaproteobacteria bacterium]|nr:tRNA (N(6)-L-threonylcarbamoyladenosine(37)-C(2))-methylthiotransferase MtaB [Deltaproteobacteria bacterium]